jgi:hypothetical protein
MWGKEPKRKYLKNKKERKREARAKTYDSQGKIYSQILFKNNIRTQDLVNSVSRIPSWQSLSHGSSQHLNTFLSG